MTLTPASPSQIANKRLRARGASAKKFALT